MQVLKNANFEKCKLGKMQIWKMQIWENSNLEICKFGKIQIWKN